MIQGTRVVDDHTHIGDFLVVKNGVRQWTAEDLVARMDRTGVDVSVVCHLISPLSEEAHIRPANDLVLKAVRRFPDRLVGVCVVNPKWGRAAVEEARRCLADGMRGIKVHPILHGNYHIDGAVMDPIMGVAADAGVPVITHSDFGSRCCTPYQVARLAVRFSAVRIVMLHLGMDTDLVAHTPDIVKDCPNVILDTSCTPDLPYPVFVNPARVVGAGRVMFGSDGPVCSVEANLAKLDVARSQFGLTDAERQQILGRTAADVFRIP